MSDPSAPDTGMPPEPEFFDGGRGAFFAMFGEAVDPEQMGAAAVDAVALHRALDADDVEGVRAVLEHTRATVPTLLTLLAGTQEVADAELRGRAGDHGRGLSVGQLDAAAELRHLAGSLPEGEYRDRFEDALRRLES